MAVFLRKTSLQGEEGKQEERMKFHIHGAVCAKTAERLEQIIQANGGAVCKSYLIEDLSYILVDPRHSRGQKFLKHPNLEIWGKSVSYTIIATALVLGKMPSLRMMGGKSPIFELKEFKESVRFNVHPCVEGKYRSIQSIKVEIAQYGGDPDANEENADIHIHGRETFTQRQAFKALTQRLRLLDDVHVESPEWLKQCITSGCYAPSSRENPPSKQPFTDIDDENLAAYLAHYTSTSITYLGINTRDLYRTLVRGKGPKAGEWGSRHTCTQWAERYEAKKGWFEKRIEELGGGRSGGLLGDSSMKEEERSVGSAVSLSSGSEEDSSNQVRNRMEIWSERFPIYVDSSTSGTPASANQSVPRESHTPESSVRRTSGSPPRGVSLAQETLLYPDILQRDSITTEPSLSSLFGPGGTSSEGCSNRTRTSVSQGVEAAEAPVTPQLSQQEQGWVGYDLDNLPDDLYVDYDEHPLYSAPGVVFDRSSTTNVTPPTRTTTTRYAPEERDRLARTALSIALQSHLRHPPQHPERQHLLAPVQKPLFLSPTPSVPTAESLIDEGRPALPSCGSWTVLSEQPDEDGDGEEDLDELEPDMEIDEGREAVVPSSYSPPIILSSTLGTPNQQKPGHLLAPKRPGLGEDESQGSTKKAKIHLPTPPSTAERRTRVRESAEERRRQSDALLERIVQRSQMSAEMEMEAPSPSRPSVAEASLTESGESEMAAAFAALARSTGLNEAQLREVVAKLAVRS